MKQDAFSALPLRPELADNLLDLGFKSMTPIQGQSLPPILDGKDVIAQGQTGSGKTAALRPRLAEPAESRSISHPGAGPVPNSRTG